MSLGRPRNEILFIENSRVREDKARECMPYTHSPLELIVSAGAHRFKRTTAMNGTDFMARGTNDRTPPRDNYAEFLERLDAAAASLTKRRESQDRTLEIVDLLYKQNYTGLRLWEDRRAKVEEFLSRCTADSGRARTLGELRDIASKMEPMFRTRTARARHRLAVLRGRREEITNSLAELERSKIKLTSARMLAQQHENLSKAVADLAGTPDGATAVLPDVGLREDLKHAREAVILAEALMEVKGN